MVILLNISSKKKKTDINFGHFAKTPKEKKCKMIWAYPPSPRPCLNLGLLRPNTKSPIKSTRSPKLSFWAPLSPKKAHSF